jgi:hypothetical protein
MSERHTHDSCAPVANFVQIDDCSIDKDWRWPSFLRLCTTVFFGSTHLNGDETMSSRDQATVTDVPTFSIGDNFDFD